MEFHRHFVSSPLLSCIACSASLGWVRLTAFSVVWWAVVQNGCGSVHLFSNFSPRVGFVGSLSGALSLVERGSLFPSSFALWKMVVLFRRVLPVIVSLSVFVREVAFGQGTDGGKDWLVFVFWPSSSWGFFSLLLLLLAGGSLHIRVGCLV